jgi:Tol biopolymer transport system component
LCTFPSGPPPERGGPGLDKYEFSEPRVVLTHTSGIAIADWLPDNSRLLITRSYPRSSRERIETLDIRNGEIQLYAERDQHNGKPVWLSAIQGVAYSAAPPNARGGQFALLISRVQPPETETAVTSEGNGAALGGSLAVEPGGRRLLYLVDRTGGRLQSWDTVTRINQATAFDIAEWGPPLTPGTQYVAHPVWSPNGSRFAIFAHSTLFLVEPGPNRVCEVPARGWVLGLYSQWSPNSRYLAIITTDEQPDPLVHTTALLVLDGLTGEQRKLTAEANQASITDVSWGPDSRHLVVFVRTSGMYREDRPTEKLFLIDVVTRDMRQVWPGRPFGGGRDGERMAWSPNGQHLAIKCPIVRDSEPILAEDRVCLISTEIRP